MTLFVSFLLLTLPIISCGLQLSNEKSQSTSQHYDNELTDQVCGRDTIPGQVPFYASIEVNSRKFHCKKCSGVLIARRWVLTTAHCTFSVFGPIQVVLGDEWNNKTIGVEKSYIHPDFNRLTQVNNIALLLLKEPVQFSRNIQPICLPEPGEDETFYGRNGTLAVWGKINQTERKLPTNMQITSSPIMKSADCWEIYENAGNKKSPYPELALCARYPVDVKPVCFPGYGNPLMVNVENHWILAGISTNKIGCKKPFSPHIYLSVGFYLNWIKRTVY
ncbi:vitamin K-dependent protein C-like [Tetranychus urticae]|uniref:Peptidase S1 domain-containing protein n=1 Tax=Tetranychus urticae TaxID=32264 RepID=T1L3I0_TETUR|nr:vitamin K-dependent protein C-like [Tetranychus urticae]